MTDLLPCPFCGGEAETELDHTVEESHAHGCRRCQIWVDEFTHGKDATALWNTRAPGWQPIEKERVIAAAHDAFLAGCEQGSDEATAYEWGASPGQSRDRAWEDFMAEWNDESAPLRDLPTPPDSGGE